ncbi:MAG TPA: ROK family transcriptional regulator [Marmoricola sp.]|nr:ROK family transcriptional regulator [Marmoricola sp.]
MARTRGGTGTNQEAVRRHNLATLLGHVHHSGGISRAQLTERMGLNRSTIADLVRELEDRSAVVQSVPETGGTTRAGAGRPSIDVNPAADAVFVLAAEVGVDTIEVARVGLGGTVLDRSSTPTPEDPAPEAVADLLAEMARKMLTSGEQGQLVGIGLALPGVVTNSAGLVRFAPNLGWSDVPLGAMLSGRIGLQVPVHLGNDAELGALAEHIRGVGRHKANVIYLSCDVGVGGGVIVGGQPMMGASGYAGEVGHVRFNPRGKKCRCGNVGCWETEIGSHAVAEAVGCPPGEIHDLEKYLQPGTKPPAALRRLGRSLGLGLGGLVNIFNPEIVIMGGVLRWVFPLVTDDVLDALDAWALRAPAEQAQIVLPWLGGDSVILGASELAFNDLLHDPVEVLGARPSKLPAGHA